MGNVRQFFLNGLELGNRASTDANFSRRLISGIAIAIKVRVFYRTFFPSAFRLLLPLLRLFGSDRQIFELWLACWTQQEIAEEVGITQGEVAKSIPNGNLAELNKTQQAAADHATDFAPPIYNIWKQQTGRGQRSGAEPVVAVLYGTGDC